MVEHCIAGRRRALQSVAYHSMAWHCVVKHCITQHCNAKHGTAPRGLGQSEVSAPCSAPWAPRKAPHEAGLMESTRWLCFQHRILKAGTGSRLILPQNDDAPKWGVLLRPKKSTNRHRMCNHVRCFFRVAFSRFWAYLEGPKTPALHREHDLEQPEAQK